MGNNDMVPCSTVGPSHIALSANTVPTRFCLRCALKSRILSKITFSIDDPPYYHLCLSLLSQPSFIVGCYLLTINPNCSLDVIMSKPL